MASQSFEPRVTIAELSSRLDGRQMSLEEFIAVLGIDEGQLAPDWALRPSLSIKYAAQIVAGHEEAKRADAERRAAYDAYIGQFDAERREKAEKAGAEAFKARMSAAKRTRVPLLGGGSEIIFDANDERRALDERREAFDREWAKFGDPESIQDFSRKQRRRRLIPA